MVKRDADVELCLLHAVFCTQNVDGDQPSCCSFRATSFVLIEHAEKVKCLLQIDMRFVCVYTRESVRKQNLLRKQLYYQYPAGNA